MPTFSPEQLRALDQAIEAQKADPCWSRIQDLHERERELYARLARGTNDTPQSAV